MFESISVPPVRQCYALSGPPGPYTDQLLAMAVQAGCVAAPISAGDRYRLTRGDADAQFLPLFAEQVAQLADAGVTLAPEVPPEGITLSSNVEPDRAYRRTVHVHGTAFGMVARAIDAGLHVACGGALRWSITGRSATLASWMGDDLRDRIGLTPEQIATEDTGLLVSVTVAVPDTFVIASMPARKITSDITRDADGDITHVEQTERDVP